jgi:phosphoribosylanthranilate isomerase
VPERVRVKICGITTAAGVRAAVEAGADAVGFVLADSPRRVALGAARELAAGLAPFVATVAVLRYPDPEEVREIVRVLRPDVVQSEPVPGLAAALGPGVRLLPVLHEGPSLEREAAQCGAAALLLEAAGRGGRGVAPDWERAARLAARVRLVLAGGLAPHNVVDAIRRVRPYAVDVSSGVESSPGVKDADLVREFVLAVRRAEDGARGGGTIAEERRP